MRGDDLLDATPSQAHLLDLLGRPRPSWAHVPLVRRARRRSAGQAPRCRHARGPRRGRGSTPRRCSPTWPPAWARVVRTRCVDGSAALASRFDPSRLAAIERWVWTPPGSADAFRRRPRQHDHAAHQRRSLREQRQPLRARTRGSLALGLNDGHEGSDLRPSRAARPPCRPRPEVGERHRRPPRPRRRPGPLDRRPRRRSSTVARSGSGVLAHRVAPRRPGPTRARAAASTMAALAGWVVVGRRRTTPAIGPAAADHTGRLGQARAPDRARG